MACAMFCYQLLTPLSLPLFLTGWSWFGCYPLLCPSNASDHDIADTNCCVSPPLLLPRWSWYCCYQPAGWCPSLLPDRCWLFYWPAGQSLPFVVTDPLASIPLLPSCWRVSLYWLVTLFCISLSLKLLLITTHLVGGPLIYMYMLTCTLS